MTTLIGHQDIQKLVADMHGAGTLPHALLLHGPMGIGKRKLCNKLAEFLICGGRYDTQAGLKIRENAPAYAQLQNNAYPDFHILEKQEKAASISVDDTRKLLERLTWTADGARVVMIDSVDELNAESANALLKTLEEPGQGVHFLLVCHQLSRILPTILSRCRKLAVQPLTADETLQVLLQEHVEETDAKDLVTLYPNSPGQALLFGVQGLAVQEKLASAFTTGLPFVTLADQLAQKKQVPLALDILLQHVAQAAKQAASAPVAETYAALQDLKNRQKSHNLSANWMMENALTLTFTTWQQHSLPPLFQTSRM